MSGAVAATPAVAVLVKAKVAHTLHPYDPEHPSDQGHGEAAVAALGADPRQVFKTLLARVDGALTVAVVPVAGTLDLKALASAVGAKKAAMADPADAERTTGYVRGGISPLGQRKALPTVVDESALRFPTVMVSAGKRDRRTRQRSLDDASRLRRRCTARSRCETGAPLAQPLRRGRVPAGSRRRQRLNAPLLEGPLALD